MATKNASLHIFVLRSIYYIVRVCTYSPSLGVLKNLVNLLKGGDWQFRKSQNTSEITLDWIETHKLAIPEIVLTSLLSRISLQQKAPSFLFPQEKRVLQITTTLSNKKTHLPYSILYGCNERIFDGLNKRLLSFVAHLIMVHLVTFSSQSVNYSSRNCSVKSDVLVVLKQNPCLTRAFLDLQKLKQLTNLDAKDTK